MKGDEKKAEGGETVVDKFNEDDILNDLANINKAKEPGPQNVRHELFPLRKHFLVRTIIYV